MSLSYKRTLLLLSLLSFVFMLLMDYDKEYAITILLPVVYFIFIILYYRDKFNYGPCSKSLLAFYGFRMCILPVLCAYGNFWIEADKSVIISKYNLGIFYMCLEFIIVILSLYFFNKVKHSRIYVSVDDGSVYSHHSFFFRFVLGSTFLFLILFIFVRPDFFHFITSEMDELFMGEEHNGFSGIEYIEDFVGTLVRPLLSFLIVGYFWEHKSRRGYFFILTVVLLNFLFVTERRIYSLLISGTCLYYIVISTQSKRFRLFINIILAIATVFMVYACLYFQFNSGEEIVSRTVQHYFSGPSLSAMALVANEKVNYVFTDFLILMWNMSLVLCALFSGLPITDYYEDLFGFYAWTPMFMDCVRFFGVFAPILLIIFVKFVVNCDERFCRSNNVVYKMTYLFIGVTMSCYMIMYMLHSVLYFMLATSTIYRYVMGDFWKHNKRIAKKILKP